MRLARFNRLVTNRLARPIAPWMPPFALISHTGRHTGRPYRTPVWVFRDRKRDHWVVALTYGHEAEWVRNVRYAGTCIMLHRGRRRRMTRVELVRAAPATMPIPAIIRLALDVLGDEVRPIATEKEERPNG
jgi:deazaflavin-dependent oxidoreductase (nitroreductase family)